MFMPMAVRTKATYIYVIV